jgi:hypothetical protein
MKRFYTSVSVTADGGIALDNRIVKTPAKVPLLLPNAALAEAVADEWRAQEDVVNPHLMPFTGLANAAIDRVAPDMPAFALGLAAYAESELLCYRAAEPPALVARQDAVWNPVLDWARGRFDISFTLVTGIMHQAQPDRMLWPPMMPGPWLRSILSSRSAGHLSSRSPLRKGIWHQTPLSTRPILMSSGKQNNGAKMTSRSKRVRSTAETF